MFENAIPENALSAYRPGGPLYLDWRSFEDVTPIRLHRGRVAAESAAQIGALLTGQSVRHLLEQIGGALRCIVLTFTATEVSFTLRFANAARQEQCLCYTYNEYLDAERMPTYTADTEEQQLMYRATLSRLAEIMPDAYLHNGAIYKDVHQYLLYK